MQSLSHKTKQYLLVTLKVLLFGITFGYIYFKLNQTDRVIWNALEGVFDRSWGLILSSSLLFIGLATLNWCFEIFKWKLMVSHVHPISWSTAVKQCLVSHTISLTTPQRIGEYGAKALYFKTGLRKKILVLNFFSHSMQMGATLLFGLLGAWWVMSNYTIPISGFNMILIFVVIVIIAFLAYRFKEQELLIKGLKISNVITFLSEIKGSIKGVVILLSLGRFLIFSFLFFQLLIFFGFPLSVVTGFSLIFTMYLLVSVIPSVFILDVVIRGGVAVWLFSLAGISEIPVLCTVLIMWLLNFVAPAIVGSFFLVSFQPVQR